MLSVLTKVETESHEGFMQEIKAGPGKWPTQARS